MGKSPTVWNDPAATDDEKSALLMDIKRNQGPGIERMVDAFRTPDGRPVSYNIYYLCEHYNQVVALCEDTTYIRCRKSNDCSVQVQYRILSF